MKTFFWVLVVVLIGYVGVKAATAFKAKTDLASRIDSKLDLVDETSIDSVKQELVHDAQALGIQLTPENISILYEDTERRSVAQQIVGGRLPGTEFRNKQITINAHYAVPILGFHMKQEITRTRIRQVQAPRRAVSPEMKQLLDEHQ